MVLRPLRSADDRQVEREPLGAVAGQVEAAAHRGDAAVHRQRQVAAARRPSRPPGARRPAWAPRRPRDRPGAGRAGTANRARGAPRAGEAACPAVAAQQPAVRADPVDARPAAVAEQVQAAQPVAAPRRASISRGGHGDRAGQVAPQHPHLAPRLRGAAEHAGAVGPPAQRPAQQPGDGGQDVQAAHVGARARRRGSGPGRLTNSGTGRHLVDVGLGDLAPVAHPPLERDGLVGGDHHQRVLPLPGLLQPRHQPARPRRPRSRPGAGGAAR